MTAERVARIFAVLTFVFVMVFFLSGCIPAANIIDSSSLVQQLRAQRLSASEAKEALCTASYRDVIKELGDKAGALCE